MLPKINHPILKLTIPSTEQEIQARPMLGKEEKLLLMAKESQDDEDILIAIKQCVNNCILDKIDIDKLTIFDLEYLFIRLRAHSVAETIKVSYKDNEDEDVYDFDIDLLKVNVKFPEKMDKMIKIDDKTSLRMKMPPASLYTDKEFLAAQKTGNGKLVLDSLVRNALDAVVQNNTAIAFEGNTKEEMETFLDDLPIPVHEKIRGFLTDLPTVYHEINYTNKKGNERKIVLNTLSDFFTLR
jgi:hypothetical protein